MCKDLIIVGASGFGREVAWLVERINAVSPTWNILGFLDDSPEMQKQIVGGYPVLGSCSASTEYREAWYVCAIGASEIRRRVIAKLGNVVFATLIDPSAVLSERVMIGEGSIICARNILTVDISIGKHVIINLDCTVGHDAVIEDYVTLYPSVNVSGITFIGNTSEIGTGTQVIQAKEIGHNTIIGAGSVVTKNIPANCTAVGIPAKPIKYQ